MKARATLFAASAILALGMAPAFAVSVDVTATKGITIGGAIGGAGGKFVPWGGTVVLDEKDAFYKGNGKCAFNVMYDMQNNGDSTTAQFKNTLVAKDATVAINSALTLKAGESRNVMTQPYLVPGTYSFNVKLDSDNNLAESNETNNIVGVKVTLNGTCGAAPAPVPAPPPPKADLTSQKGIAIGGKSTPWGSLVTINDSNVALMSNGRCAVNITYDVANVGAAASGNFNNKIFVSDALGSVQAQATLANGASRLVTTQAYLSPGVSAVRLVIDADASVAESNETNNTFTVAVKLDSTCKPAPAPVPAPAPATGTRK